MKYLTKDWYNQMGVLENSSEGIKKIPDKDYTDADINEIYANELNKRIRAEKKYYNTPPNIDFELGLLEDPEMTLDDWTFIIGEDEQRYYPKNKSEILALLQQDLGQRHSAFESRLPFDSAEIITEFEDTYRSGVEFAEEQFPKWVCEQVDHRLLALNMMPQSVLTKLRKEDRKKQRAFQRLDERIGSALYEEASKIPAEIRENFGFHDSCILYFKKIDKDYCMTLRLDGDIFDEGRTPYLRLWFRNAVILEREKGITIRPRLYKDRGYRSNCHWLYEELYRLEDGGYEVHMMFWVSELKYLTLQCKEIIIEPDITYPN